MVYSEFIPLSIVPNNTPKSNFTVDHDLGIVNVTYDRDSNIVLNGYFQPFLLQCPHCIQHHSNWKKRLFIIRNMLYMLFNAHLGSQVGPPCGPQLPC